MKNLIFSPAMRNRGYRTIHRGYRTIHRDYRKVMQSLRQRGVLSTLRRIPGGLRGRMYEVHRWAAESAFDQTYGVATRGKIEVTAIPDIESENWIWGVWYEPTNPDVFDEMLDAAAIEPEYYSFIDFGSGKGRALLLASRLPFRRVIGVEYSRSLHQIAEQNLRSVTTKRRSGPVESVCLDATSFPIPDEPMVLYFYDPFRQQIMETVRDNVVHSYEGNPRSMVVIYYDPEHSDVWDAVGFLERYAWSNVAGRKYVIYKTRSS